MTYRLGIDIGADHTVWATVSRAGDRPPTVDGAVVDSVVAVAGDRMVGGADVATADSPQHVTRGFVDRLGDPNPLIVGGTPYGAESLVACLVSSVVDETRKRLGEQPTAVVLVHTDNLDDYRTGLLTEAARVAGIPLTSLILVPRNDAEAATSTEKLKFPAALGAAVGASLIGWARVPDALVAAAGIGIDAGAAAGGVALGTGGAALGASAAGGGYGAAAAAGPAGVPLSSLAGPAGTPLASVGPAGTPLASVGPSGTPLATGAGPAGTPLGGPPGSPLSVSRHSRKALKHLIKTPKTLAVGAAAAAAAAVATVAATGGDDGPASSPVIEVSIDTPTAETLAVASLAECVVGTWTVNNESYAARFSDLFAGSGMTAAVSGTVVIVVTPDGLWTISHDNWGVSLANEVLEVTTVGTGVDTGQGDFRDDGSFTFTNTALGTVFEVSALANGVVFPAPPELSTTPSVTVGSGTYSCDADIMLLATDTPFALQLHRTA